MTGARTVPPGPAEARSPWAEGLTQMVQRLGVALGQAPPPSQRTALFRPLPLDPMAWLQHTFQTYFQTPDGRTVPLAPHHEAFWAWLWALRPGLPCHTFISILARGGGKSTSIELGGAVVGYFGLRRYALYLSDTQKQADDHVANIGVALEQLGVERAINRYGFSRGWNINRLRTADGFTMDAIGLDAPARGVRMGEDRPDLIFLDDLDEQLDAPATTAKKIDIVTRKILPTGSSALAVVGVQNLPNRDGIFAQLVDGRAEFLLDRVISGPHPALRELPLQDWYTTEKAPDGRTRLRITAGTPVWAGQDIAACETLLNLIGPRAFLIECQHLIAALEGKLFKREWFKVVPDWPRQARLVRYWDFASTEEPHRPARTTRDPDWTVGLLLGLWQGQFFVVDMRRARLSPKGVEDLVRQTAAVDGPRVHIWLEEEGGSSGKAVTADFRLRVLVGYPVSAWHSTGSKGERARPVSSAAEAGNVFLVQGSWNQAFLEEVPLFGNPGVHDDIVDALSGAHYALTLGSSALPQDLDWQQALEDVQQPALVTRTMGAALLPGNVRRSWLDDLADEDSPWG